MVTDKKTQLPKKQVKSNSSTAVEGDSAEQVTASTRQPPASQKAAADSAKKPSPKTDASSAGKPMAKSSSLLLKVFMVLLLAALAGACWLAWTHWQQREGLNQTFQASLGDLNAELAQQQQLNLRSAQQQLQIINDLQDQLYSLRLMTNRQAQQIQTLGSANQGDWLLNEALYLVRLASQRLQVERSSEIPLAILQNVDAIFVQLNDPDLAAVRNALAVDIAALRMAKKVDREGIYLELQAISSTLETLTVLEPRVEQEAATDASKEVNSFEPKVAWITQTLARLSEKLANLVVVQKRQQPIEPLLTGAEQAIVRQNISLLLQQAQSALLSEQQSIYRSSLQQAAKLVHSYFPLNSESEVLLSRLQTLSDVMISQQLPDLSASYNAIQDAIQAGGADEEPAK